MTSEQITRLETEVNRLEALQLAAAEKGDVETVERLGKTLTACYSALGAAQFSIAS